MKENLIVTKTYNFALKIVSLNKSLVSRNKYILSKQLLRSGTSIGANVEEARETHYWLRLLKDSNYIENETFQEMEKELSSILRILFKIIQSSKE